MGAAARSAAFFAAKERPMISELHKDAQSKTHRKNEQYQLLELLRVAN
jgi:hypothetical protein